MRSRRNFLRLIHPTAVFARIHPTANSPPDSQGPLETSQPGSKSWGLSHLPDKPRKVRCRRIFSPCTLPQEPAPVTEKKNRQLGSTSGKPKCDVRSIRFGCRGWYCFSPKRPWAMTPEPTAQPHPPVENPDPSGARKEKQLLLRTPKTIRPFGEFGFDGPPGHCSLFFFQFASVCTFSKFLRL